MGKQHRKAWKLLGVLVLACAVFISVPLRVHAADVSSEFHGNSWRYQDGVPITETGEAAVSTLSDVDTSEVSLFRGSDGWYYYRYYDAEGDVHDVRVPNAVKKGIDVSSWQKSINWSSVKASDVDFAIIRCGWGDNVTTDKDGNGILDQDDKYWKINADACTRLGIPFGVYIYSYAETVEQAKSEAEHVLRLVKGYNLSYPIYFDMEDAVQAKLSNAELAVLAKTFCGIIESHGYDVGVYASKLWFDKKLTDPCFDTWERWVAQWNTSCTYQKDFRLWQATSSGSVPGIEGRVDLNFEMDPDMPNDALLDAWYVTSGAYDFITKYEIMGRLGETNMFGPYESLSRGQMATILWRLCGEPSYTGSVPFSDVSPSSYYYEAIGWAASEGLLSGYSNGTFGPDGAVTVEQLAAFMQRFGLMRREHMTVSGSQGLSKIDDAGAISPFAEDAVNWCIEQGLMTDYLNETDDHVNPTRAAARCEAASFIHRLYTTAFDYPSDVGVMDWYVTGGAYDFVTDSGLITGYANGSFGPSGILTRGQTATILYRLAGSPTVAAGDNFQDNADPNAFYYDALLWARSTGVINGYGDGSTFGPNNPVTREQLAAMLSNYASKIEHIDCSSTCANLDRIAGSEDVSSWARQAMGWAVDEGLLSGMETSHGRDIAPQSSASRAMMAAMLTNFVKGVL